MAMTQKDLDKVNMTMMAGLIGNKGLDAAGPLYHGAAEEFQSAYGHIYIPLIFEHKGQPPKQEVDKARKQASDELEKLAKESNTAAKSTMYGLTIRKQVAGIEGPEIIMGPVDKDYIGKIKSMSPFEGSIALLRLATHILRGSTWERIEEDERQDLIDEQEEYRELQQKRAARSEKKRQRRS